MAGTRQVEAAAQCIQRPYKSTQRHYNIDVRIYCHNADIRMSYTTFWDRAGDGSRSWYHDPKWVEPIMAIG